jgi:hypothetical protein
MPQGLSRSPKISPEERHKISPTRSRWSWPLAAGLSPPHRFDENNQERPFGRPPIRSGHDHGSRTIMRRPCNRDFSPLPVLAGSGQPAGQAGPQGRSRPPANSLGMALFAPARGLGWKPSRRAAFWKISHHLPQPRNPAGYYQPRAAAFRDMAHGLGNPFALNPIPQGDGSRKGKSRQAWLGGFWVDGTLGPASYSSSSLMVADISKISLEFFRI